MSASAFDKAIPILRQLLADEPWLPQGVAMLAQAYTESGQSANAIALVQEAVTVEPGFYEMLASYKLAISLEGIHARYRMGKTVGEGFSRIPGSMKGFALVSRL